MNGVVCVACTLAVPADINGDGTVDFVGALMGLSSIVWYNGASGWSSTVIYSGCNGATDVNVVDINGDGLPDVFATCEGDGMGGPMSSGGALYALNSPAAIFTTAVLAASTTGVNAAQRVVLADVSGVCALLFWVARGRTRGLILICPCAGDGLLDILIAGRGDNLLGYFKNTGSPTAPAFPSYLSIGTCTKCWDIAVGDFINADGKLDIVTCGNGEASGGGIWYYQNSGGGTFSSPLALYTAGSVSRIALYDVTGDGKLDLFALQLTAGSQAVVYYTGTGFSAAFIVGGTVAAVNSGVGLHLIDFDGDGDGDVIASGRNSGEVMLVENTGTVTAPVWYKQVVTSTLTQAQCAVAFDVDGDGKKDIISESWDTGAIVWCVCFRRQAWATYHLLFPSLTGTRMAAQPLHPAPAP